MKKKILSMTLALCLVFGSAAALPQGTFAQGTAITASAALTSGDYNYNVLSDGTVELTCYKGISGVQVNIPSSIAGKKVTVIGEDTFASKKVTGVTIPEGVKTIKGGAFSKSTINTVSIPSTVTSIDLPSAFYGCDNLRTISVSTANKTYASVDGALLNKAKTELLCCPGGKNAYTVPNTVKTVKSKAFYTLKNLQTITLSDSVTTVEKEAVRNCYALRTINVGAGATSLSGVESNGYALAMDCANLTDINVAAANKTYSSEDGVLYNKAKTILYRCPAHKSSVTILPSAAKIGYTAFSHNNALRSIYIPNNIKTIDRYAFSECSALSTVILTGGITEIPECAFYGCGKLKSISIPRGVKKIGPKAFMSCRELAAVNIPDSVTAISSLAFKYTSVKDVYIPSSVTAMTSSDIFDGGITVYGQKNTTAQTYAQKNNFTFKEIPTPLTRFAGAGRYDTAKTISVEGSAATSKTVVLAYGLGYADALAGVPLASALGAPILLTAKDTLPEETLGEIKRIGANKVIILGGEGAVSKNVENVLKNNSITVERCAGTTRFETAAKIAHKLDPEPSEIFFVYGFNYADALSVSTVAAVKKAPVIYLKTSGGLDAQTAAYLKSVKGKVKNACVIGGEGVISSDMMNEAANALGLKAGTTVKRIAGKNRYATCVEVNTSFSSVLTGKAMCIAKGLDFPDALAGGVFAAKNKAPLLLADKALTTEQKAFIKQKKATKLYIFGAAGAVPNSLVQSISSL